MNYMKDHPIQLYTILLLNQVCYDNVSSVSFSYFLYMLESN